MNEFLKNELLFWKLVRNDLENYLLKLWCQSKEWCGRQPSQEPRGLFIDAAISLAFV